MPLLNGVDSSHAGGMLMVAACAGTTVKPASLSSWMVCGLCCPNQSEEPCAHQQGGDAQAEVERRNRTTPGSMEPAEHFEDHESREDRHQQAADRPEGERSSLESRRPDDRRMRWRGVQRRCRWAGAIGATGSETHRAPFRAEGEGAPTVHAGHSGRLIHCCLIGRRVTIGYFRNRRRWTCSKSRAHGIRAQTTSHHAPRRTVGPRRGETDALETPRSSRRSSPRPSTSTRGTVL